MPEGGLDLLSRWARGIAAGDSARIVATGSDPGKGRGGRGFAVPIFALIFLLAFDKGLIARARHAPGLMKLGEWSFAIYMVHYIAMYFLPFFGLPERPGQASIGGLAASIAAGALAWRFVERPLGEAMRRRLLNAWGRLRDR